MRRARREQKRLRTYLRRVLRDIERKIAFLPGVSEHLKHLLGIAHRIHAQQRHDKHKVYSVHAPEVECLAKDKARKQYEFGVKVSVVSTNRDNVVVGMQALPGYPYDGHTLRAAIAQTTTLTGVVPRQAFVDRGYRGHRFHQLKVWISGARRGVTAWIRKRLRRRNAIEPVIGHMKTDGRLARNFLRGAEGDAMNASCAAPATICARYSPGSALSSRKIMQPLNSGRLFQGRLTMTMCSID
jgi:transposase, IS5 family